VPADKFIRKGPAFSNKGQQGSSSFLKKRTKKLLLCWLMRQARSMLTAASKSFLVLFFKKNCFLRARLLSGLNTPLRSTNHTKVPVRHGGERDRHAERLGPGGQHRRHSGHANKQLDALLPWNLKAVALGRRLRYGEGREGAVAACRKKAAHRAG
jgi:hypothetical protein